jgi:hypothetical protein
MKAIQETQTIEIKVIGELKDLEKIEVGENIRVSSEIRSYIGPEKVITKPTKRNRHLITLTQPKDNVFTRVERHYWFGKKGEILYGGIEINTQD